MFVLLSDPSETEMGYVPATADADEPGLFIAN